jgi:2-dehydro-3-deoxyphosphogluconate aldolase/(4S)-4-hydroxy-2-oxoglutarate aldolase
MWNPKRSSGREEALIATAASTVETVTQLRALGVVPVVELDSADDAEPLLDALLAAGLPAAEVTLRTAAGLDALRVLRRDRPEALVGAGTVRSLAEAERVITAGAQFVVSPSTYPELIELCHSAGVLALPGVCTPTEVDAAVRAGASLVKFFPAEAIGGVAFLKALFGPFPDVQFVPTGGISPSNLAAYLELPQVAACGGSWIVAPTLVRERAFAHVEALARAAVAIVAEVRGRA